MKAIFDKNCILVGWYEQQNKNVFSRELIWIGFVDGNYFFAKSGRWLGGFINGTFVDKAGKPVVWLEGYTPMAAKLLMPPIQPMIPAQPLTPLRPLMPLTPLRPLVPLGGWSIMKWNDYISQ